MEIRNNAYPNCSTVMNDSTFGGRVEWSKWDNFDPGDTGHVDDSASLTAFCLAHVLQGDFCAAYHSSL